MNAKERKRRQTVLLAADVGSYSISTVSLAVQMAAAINSKLQGLFIEDEDLLQVTGLPITREISLATARERPTDVDKMRRSMRSVARQFEQTLKQEAGALQIGWSFDYVRGRARDVGLEHGTDVTYMILGQPVSHRLRSRPERTPCKILLIANESRHQKQALQVVLDQFKKEKVELTLVEDRPDGKIANEIEKMERNKSLELGLKRLTREQLLEQLGQLGSAFSCAIISRHEKPELMSRVLKSLSCPVILVA
jgi:hypothetical protein